MTASTTTNAGRAALDPRTLFMIVAGVCLAALLLWFMLHFKARQQELQDTNDQIESTATTLADLQNKQAQLPAMREDVKKLQDDQKKFASALPATAQMGQMVKDLRDSVVANGGSIDTITTNPNNTATNLPAGVQPIDITLTMKGRFAPIYQTLQNVETMGRFTKIKDATISLPKADATDPTLNGTINMTTYTFDPAAVVPVTPPAGTTAAPSAPAAPGGKS